MVCALLLLRRQELLRLKSDAEALAEAGPSGERRAEDVVPGSVGATWSQVDGHVVV